MNDVEAVSKTEIAAIHLLLERNHGQLYADLWKIGVNLALRIGDLRLLKYEDLNMVERSARLVEQKTGKKKMVRLNSVVIDIVNRRRLDYPDDVWLFQVHCNRAKDKPVTRQAFSWVLKQAGALLDLNINTHSMRKSRGKALYDDGIPIERIAQVLNHSNPSSTLRYLGITREQVLRTFDDYEL